MPGAKSSEGFFGPGLFKFLRELEKNNNRVWFQRNKARYESEVQAPALRFITAMGPRLARFSSHLVADPRPFGGSLGRIYRDTRFSKDKSPYKTWVGIHFAHEKATKQENLPGFMMVLYPGECGVSSGVWHPSPAGLTNIRNAIVDSPDRWGKVVKGGIKILGDSYVRVPAGYDPKHRYADDLRRKDFYARAPIADKSVNGPSLGPAFEAACRELNPLNEFLASALSIPW
jgi:uncharacterized protein (TIGR02453 family)